MIKKLLIIAVFCLIGANAFAVPALQLYIPDATYYEDSPWTPTHDSWIATSNPFDLWVVGGSKNGKIIEILDVTLYMSIFDTDYANIMDGYSDPLITLVGEDATFVINAEDFSEEKETPELLSKHGIYPTHYASISLSDLLVGTANEVIYDYQPTDGLGVGGSDKGDIQTFTVTYNKEMLQFIHFDLTGSYDKKIGKNKYVRKPLFAPYSHDADTPPGVVPEPATILLMLSGLLGMFGIKFGRKKV